MTPQYEHDCDECTPPKVEYAMVADHGEHPGCGHWWGSKAQAGAICPFPAIGYITRTQQPDGSYKYGWDSA